MLFLGIISWKGVLCFIGGVSFLSGGVGGMIHGGSIGFGGGAFSEKNRKMGGGGWGMPPTMANPPMSYPKII